MPSLYNHMYSEDALEFMAQRTDSTRRDTRMSIYIHPKK